MASIEKRARDGKVRWYARYRDPAGRQRTKTFDRKVDADRFITTVESSKLVGTYIDPTAAKLTVGAWSKRWIDGQTHLKPSTAERYQGILREHIIPRWGTTKLSDVNHGDVQAWVSQLAKTRSAATTRKVHRVLSLILDLAVKDDRLARNSAVGVSLPRVVPGEHRYLTHLQVRQLADESAAPAPELMSKHRRHSERRADEYRLVVLFLAYTGVRFGEMAALRVGRLDLMRRRAAVVESVVEVKGALVWGTPKGHERRDVPIPRFLVDDLAAHVAGRSPEDLVFTGVRGGGVLRNRIFRRAAFDRAAETIGQKGMHPHELRHTAASLAKVRGIASDASLDDLCDRFSIRDRGCGLLGAA